MLKLNSKLSKKGFSLIELMVAVAILAMAIFGIFHAYSVGFMGMADARDRTVATNYAREAMEDVKNMDFELVTNENLGTAESVGEKFTKVISVNTENVNLKKITTLVYWNNRNGKTINIETSMYINRTLFNPGEAAKIVLYADPYYSVLPSIDETIDLIAVIKDASGNTKIYWSGENICFTIISGSELGALPDGVSGGVDTNGGIAQTIFTPSNYEIGGVVQQGDVVIEASVELLDGSTISDIITITVTLGVVRIELLAVPNNIDADGTSTSTVTATLVDSSGGTVEDAPNEIIFNISGEGTFVDSASGGSPLPDTVPMSNSGGIATIYVESITDTPGVATVTASSEGLLSDFVSIITTGVATSISVSVDPDLIYIGSTGALVTLEIRDENGNPVKYDGDIILATSDGTGTFGQNPVNPTTNNPANTSSASTTFSSDSKGIVTITATAINEDLAEGNATIDVRYALIANKITIKAIPKNISAGGDADSEITATIKQDTTVISNYDKDITFEIVSDTSSSQDALLFSDYYGFGQSLTVAGEQYGNDGEAMVYLKPASEVGICTIKVSTVNSLGDLIDNTVEVGFYSGEHHIELTAVPSKMLVNGDSCRVTARVVDEGGTQVDTYSEDITFTILVGWPKNVKFTMTGTSSLTKTLTGGETFVDLISQKDAGTVTLKASSFTGMTDITGYLNIPVDINFLDLVDPPIIAYNDELKEVSFDIEVKGAELILEEMQVSWSPDISENLIKIEINPNSTSDIVIYPNTSTPISSGGLINVDDITLWEGISNVKLYFNESMSEKTLEVIFNPNSGNYLVEFDVPST